MEDTFLYNIIAYDVEISRKDMKFILNTHISQTNPQKLHYLEHNTDIGFSYISTINIQKEIHKLSKIFPNTYFIFKKYDRKNHNIVEFHILKGGEEIEQLFCFNADVCKKSPSFRLE